MRLLKLAHWLLLAGLGGASLVSAVAAQIVPQRVVLLPLPVDTSVNSSSVVHRGPRHWTAQGVRGGSRFGMSVASAGDVNGDGYADLLIGAPRHSGPAVQSGFVALFGGGSNGLGSSASWFSESSMNMAHRGASVALADANGDKIADLFVLVPGLANASRQFGRVLVFAGSSQVPGQPVALLPELKDSNFEIGTITSAGDINGDGYDDIIIASPRFTKSSRQEGAAFLYLGSSNGIATNHSWVVYGGRANAAFASSVCGVGDVNGDGFNDVLIGATGFDTKGKDTGRALLFLGSSKGLQTNAVWWVDGFAPETRFGRGLSKAGDVNGDGIGDFLVGAPGEGTNGDLPGTIFLYLGSNSEIAREPAWSASGENPGASFGISICSPGDLDGDNHPDLLAGAPGADPAFPREGAVYLYRGNGTAFSARPDWILEGGEHSGRIGVLLRSLGDVNGDGYPDFALGSPFYNVPAQRRTRLIESAGRVDVFYGGPMGFRIGEVFPVDGVNSGIKPRATPGPVPRKPELTPWSQRRFGYLLVACIALLLALGVYGLRLARDRATRDERARIASDLHDDLGAHLSRLQSQGPSTHAETARQAVLALDRAVWAVNPENDTLENLITFVGQYAAEFFSGSGIRVRFVAPTEVPHVPIAAELRKNTFLAVKEALNNVLKHSGANEVVITLKLEQRLLSLAIADNGRGISGRSDTSAGNGLKNMAERMRNVSGHFKIASGQSGAGTTVLLEVKI
ncbi:MAG TPA: FG-GAP-like repeat-containing protein [Candidatus Saccharimonadales bacterium]|nr:FG-GAP-like repeat-containing protein [Candidatus Saccharimonadales bacterium]